MVERQRPERAFFVGFLVAAAFVFVIPILFRFHTVLATVGSLLAGATIGTFVRLFGHAISFRFGLMAAVLTFLCINVSGLISHCLSMDLLTVFPCEPMTLASHWIIVGIATVLAFFLGQKQVRVSDLIAERK